MASAMDKLAPAAVTVERREDGALLLRCPRPLGPVPRCVGDWLVAWAARAPERVFLADRARSLSYADVLARVRRVARGLLARGAGRGAPVAILCDNGVDHAIVALAAMHVGAPVAPVSPAYALLSKDFMKLRAIFELVSPRVVLAGSPAFDPALDAVGATDAPIDELGAAEPDAAVDAAFAAVTPDTTAKILFTSGSTGAPKGVINTQRMLCASQEALAMGWPFLAARPPVLVDWLPWSHTFGGNHNFHLALRNGGTLFVDGGKPTPALIGVTVENLKRLSPTVYFNVPRGFDLLIPELERDDEAAKAFFRELDAVFYAAAALPASLWDRLAALAKRHGSPVMMLSAWGATETSPLATQVHFPIRRAGVVGLPVPGCELKLVPNGQKLEARVRGPNVTPGYFARDDLTRAAFDEEGFYRTGDAMKLADPEEPARGVVFDGRIAEDFKLLTGTWVHVGAARTRLITAADPVVQDAVITGADRDEVGALVFLTPAGAALDEASLSARLDAALRAIASEPGSPRRVRVLRDPPSLDAGEITDKGYLNQRRLLETRAADVERLYA